MWRIERCGSNFFLRMPSMCTVMHRDWRMNVIISRLTNPRRACQSQVFRLIFFIPVPLPSSPFPFSCSVVLVCCARFLPRDRMMHWNSRPLRWAIQGISLRARFSIGCLGKKARGPEERAVLPTLDAIQVIHSDLAFVGEGHDRSAERMRGKPATRNAENHVSMWRACRNLIVVAQRTRKTAIRFRERSSKILKSLESAFCTPDSSSQSRRLRNYIRQE